jgi:hypothetical protein
MSFPANKMFIQRYLSIWLFGLSLSKSKLAFSTPGGLNVEIDATLMLDKPHAVMVLTMIVHTNL